MTVPGQLSLPPRAGPGYVYSRVQCVWGVVCARCSGPQRRGMGALLSADGAVAGSGDQRLPPPPIVPQRGTRGAPWTAGVLSLLRAQRATPGVAAAAVPVAVRMGGRLRGVQSTSLPLERFGEQSSSVSPPRLGHLGRDGAQRASPPADPSCGQGGGVVAARGG